MCRMRRHEFTAHGDANLRPKNPDPHASLSRHTISVMLVVWFVSGIVMIYAGGMPRSTPSGD